MTLQTLEIRTDGCRLVGRTRSSAGEGIGRGFKFVRYDAVGITLLSPFVPDWFNQ